MPVQSTGVFGIPSATRSIGAGSSGTAIVASSGAGPSSGAPNKDRGARSRLFRSPQDERRDTATPSFSLRKLHRMTRAYAGQGGRTDSARRNTRGQRSLGDGFGAAPLCAAADGTAEPVMRSTANVVRAEAAAGTETRHAPCSEWRVRLLAKANEDVPGSAGTRVTVRARPGLQSDVSYEPQGLEVPANECRGSK
jgi:hypothetical protein